MKIVLPVSDQEFGQVFRLARRIKYLGGIQDYELLIVSTMRAAWDIDKVTNEFLGQVGKLSVYTLPDENEEGWPESANHMFYHTVCHLEATNNEEPWYWFESDNVPLKPDWMDALKQEYFEIGKPYMGVVNNTRHFQRSTGATWLEGKHMVGTGIYPADFATRCKAIHHMNRTAFDIYIADEIMPEVHPTTLIAHRWNTRNYRLVEGVVTADLSPLGAADWVNDIETAVVVHGVKDDSLENLLAQYQLNA